MGVSIYVCPRQEFSFCLMAAVRVVETAMHTLAGQVWLVAIVAACQAINTLA